jgi:hypothetical protein
VGTPPLPKKKGHTMATAEEYEKVLGKAEMRGVGSLSSVEKDMLKRLLSESGARGNRARKILDR